jgi:hypothetical protein
MTKITLKLSFVFFVTCNLNAKDEVDFNTQIKPLLSNRCIACHGPDEENREAGLRLDTFEGATRDLDGYSAIVAGNPEDSEILFRVTLEDGDQELMPPKGRGKRLTEAEVALLTEWIKQGAKFDKHWSYKAPVRGNVPTTVHPVDFFIDEKLEMEGLSRSISADPRTLARRVSLDLIGLPPTLEELNQFLADKNSDSYDKYVDRLLARPEFGEHWARMWLDLARYADSAGYADDRPRTIWAFRDYVIKAFNKNLPFDQFTIEQLAGDLLPEPTEQQLIATAFHRNTQTNNEGGTNDEEFRNVAVVDRVNTTFATWMGTTMACAQCHTHKYDPITHEEYFQSFDILNQTQDADKRDESPVVSFYSDQQKKMRSKYESEIKQLGESLKSPLGSDELSKKLIDWEKDISTTKWQVLKPTKVKAVSGATLTVGEDGSVLASGIKKVTDEYRLTFQSSLEKISALRVEFLSDDSLTDGGPSRNHNLVLNEIILNSMGFDDSERGAKKGQFVRIELDGKDRILHVAEVQAFVGEENVAVNGKARQSTTGYGGLAKLAIDGNTDGDFHKSKSVTHNANGDAEAWWEVDLGKEQNLTKLGIWNRTDSGLHSRLDGFRLQVLSGDRRVVWEKTFSQAPKREVVVPLDGAEVGQFVKASASYEQKKFEAFNAIDGNIKKDSGWAIAGGQGRDHDGVFTLKRPIAGGDLSIRLLQNYPNHSIGKFRLSVTEKLNPAPAMPDRIKHILKVVYADRTEKQNEELMRFFIQHGPEGKKINDRVATLRKKLDSIKPYSSVPVLKEVVSANQRKTFIHLRGSYLNHGPQVHANFPSALAPPLPGVTKPNRLDLAHWIMNKDNPLTARVSANRFWEKIFGIGLVSTSEEFGSQGELPSHPQLLDWLATEFVRMEWNMKAFIKLLVTSKTYRQSSHVTDEMAARDPANRLLARGPRVRLSAEMVRDQALAVSGLLSKKMFGPPVRPPQPDMGIKAAFGGGIDWKTSEGEDRFRRGIYTNWRRSNPYPSMATFDAPNREVCTVRRGTTNTPLQALVTMNDPVYVEAAQSLARIMIKSANSLEKQLITGFEICLSREPEKFEIDRLKALFNQIKERYANDTGLAQKMATDPIGAAPKDTNLVDLAALTVTGNVLLNLDEMMMKR